MAHDYEPPATRTEKREQQAEVDARIDALMKTRVACDDRCVGDCGTVLPSGRYPRPKEPFWNLRWRCDGTGPAHTGGK